MLLILRDAFFGGKRFVHFEKNLGIAKNILTARLKLLIEEGIMEKQESHPGAHAEYVLTEKGLALQPILLSMTHWGDKYMPDVQGRRITFVERKTGQPIRQMSVVSKGGRVLAPREIMAVRGSGRNSPT